MSTNVLATYTTKLGKNYVLFPKKKTCINYSLYFRDCEFKFMKFVHSYYNELNHKISNFSGLRPIRIARKINTTIKQAKHGAICL